MGRSAPYREVHILLFQHGVESEGIAGQDEWTAFARPPRRDNPAARPGPEPLPV
jgi:hypothetical protein